MITEAITQEQMDEARDSAFVTLLRQKWARKREELREMVITNVMTAGAHAPIVEAQAGAEREIAEFLRDLTKGQNL